MRDIFAYIDGNLYYLNTRGRMVKGSKAGHLAVNGYIKITVNRRYLLAHRVIYEMFHGSIPKGMQIDHINRNRADNRIENLRAVTRQENQFNRGAKGYSWNSGSKKWQAHIATHSKNKSLGSFNTKEEAREAYLKAKEKLHVIEE